MLNLDTEIERNLALCLIIPLLLCVLITVYVSIGAATVEFKHAMWTSVVQNPPALGNFYRSHFRWGWFLPITAFGWGTFLIRKPCCRLKDIVFLVGTESVLLSLWISLTALSFYLCNQSFRCDIR